MENLITTGRGTTTRTTFAAIGGLFLGPKMDQDRESTISYLYKLQHAAPNNLRTSIFSY